MTVHPAAAVIIGFSIQGLAIARSLTRQGVKVYVAVPDGDLSGSLFKHPTRYTSRATFIEGGTLRGADVPRVLNDIRSRIPESPLVLFPTTDDSVIALAEYWHDLDDSFVVSWSSHRTRVLEIIHKRNLPEICRSADVLIPQTRRVGSAEEVDACIETLRLPILVKPDCQSFSFKTHLCDDHDEFRRFVLERQDEWPLVAQEWISGPDTSLYSFSCLSHADGVVGGVVTRKIRSSPPSRGIGTVFETLNDDDVDAAGRRIVNALHIVGPVATEFKKDDSGRLWLIEANVGRTEYCVDLLVGAGFDLPYLDFQLSIGGPVATDVQTSPRVWYDTDKEPFVYWAACMKQLSLRPFGKKAIFPYLFREGLRVNGAAAVEIGKKFLRRLLQKMPLGSPST